MNVTNSFYQVIGRDTFNGLAGRDQRIDAQMGAVEFSVDFDFFRYRLAGFYASGDETDRQQGEGFDAIVDHPNFAGGEFSFWNQQEIRLTQTGVEWSVQIACFPPCAATRFRGSPISSTPVWGFSTRASTST